MDNWNVSPQEKQSFESQFASLNPVDGNINGEKAKGFFVQSNLPPKILAFIWELSDITRDGQLNISEFIVACKLIQMKLRGFNIPPTLPPPLADLVIGKGTPLVVPTIIPAVPAISTAPISSVPVLHPLSSASPILGISSVSSVPTVLSAPVQPLTLVTTTSVTPPALPSVIPSGSTTPITTPPAQSIEGTPTNSSPNGTYEWSVPYNTKLKYTQMFNQADKGRTGFLTGNQARSIMVLTQLPIEMLAKIWQVSDIDGDGQLTCEEFVLAMHLCDMAKAGKELKIPLPPDLIPPTFFKKTRQNSLTSLGSNDGVTTSITSPQAAFEDKRKENYEKGQAELERRRKALFEIQRQEREERERLEREEEERKEKIRFEQEKRKQEEMEKHLQKQREIEREKEIERQKALEQRENVRKEMERQRHFEWEKQRIQDLEIRLKSEIALIMSMREKDCTLNAEYQVLCDKVRELTQQAGETRNGVNAVKSTIDGMRTSRDQLLSDITSLKAQLKEQNHRLISLNKEKISFEAKKQMSSNIKSEEQIKIDVMNQEAVLIQLREDVKEIRNELDRKKLDYNSNVEQLNTLKDDTTQVIKICETIYSDFRSRKEQVLELKAKRLNNVASWNNSAWDATPDAWSDEPVETVESRKVRALYEFLARNTDELSFQPGDIITLSATQNTEPGWLAGELQGKTGWFPESYVEDIDDSGVSLASVKEGRSLSNAADPTLEDIAEVPENVSETGSTVDDSYIPTVESETPTLDAGIIASLAVQSLYEYNAKNENQLSLNKGDIIKVSKKCENWYYGDNQGYSGWFPVSYVKEITGPETTETTSDFDEYYVASYPYNSTEPDDLCFEQNDVIKVIKKDGEWWTGILRGKYGVFPSNYVQKTNYQPPFSPLSETNHMPRCASAPPTQFENQTVITSRSMTPDFSSFNEMETSKRKPEIATVIAPYQATSKEQLSLHRGQLIMIRKKTTSGWWEGESHIKGKKRQIGWFPASYVKVVGGGGATSPVNTELTRKQSFPSNSTTSTSSEQVMALYKYTALNTDELSFEKGDVIKMIAKEEPDWWKGELNGVVGLFPSNYVQSLCKFSL